MTAHQFAIGVCCCGAMMTACGGSPSAPSAAPGPTLTTQSPPAVRFNVRVLSRDRYVLVNGLPYYAPFAQTAAELVGGNMVPDEQREKLTSADGSVTWRVYPGVAYKLKVRGSEYFGNTVLGGDADWILFICGVDLQGSVLIPNVTAPCSGSTSSLRNFHLSPDQRLVRLR